MAMIGIDLGTTNSLVAHWEANQAVLIPNALGNFLTPSVVGIDDSGELLVGAPARERLQTHPEATAATFKRFMGTDKRFTLGRNNFRAEELSALVLRSLKADAEAYLGEPVTEAIISVPAYFNDPQRKATRSAGTLAGLEVKRLINEPTAAAIAYGLHEKPEFSTIMVLDLGGGTFDVSVLEMFEGVMQVHASAGDNYLGGEDFVDVLAAGFCTATDLRVSDLDLIASARLRAAAERCKRELSAAHVAAMRVPIQDRVVEHSFTREDFESLSEGLLQRVRVPVERALRDASLSTDDLDAVVIVGGASRMPMVRAFAGKLLGRLPFTHINADKAIATGTAVQVGLMSKDSGLEETVLTDVSPYSLGIGVWNRNGQADEDLFSPIIERNAPVPISRVGNYVTVSDGQTAIEVNVYQGESRLVKDNINLGTLSIPVPRGPAGEQSVEVRFTYDIDGLLEVTVTAQSSGKERVLVIEGEQGALSEADIQKRLEALAHLKVHPRDQVENRTLLARGERLYTERLGDEREYVQMLLGQFEAALQKQDLAVLEVARAQLNDAFEQLETDWTIC